ncbi:MAG TPA: ATP-binding protein, partial [Gemmataceae bacterium]
TAGDHAGGPAALFGGSEEIARAFEEALAGRPGRVLGASVTAPGAADGRAVDCLFYPVPEDGVRAVVAFAWDRTEQRELEQRLRQAGKLEAIGLLAGGVAHDFNNLLAAIRGNLELVELPEDHPGQQRLAEAEHAVQQAAHLAGQLLRFARRKDIQLSPVDVGEVIAGAAPLLRRAVGPRVALEVRGGTGGWRVLGDAAQIEQVLMNLAVNARDAMPQGGRLLIETAPVTLTGEEAERLGGPPEPVGLPAGSAVPGEFVRVRVTDTGCGMDEQTRARLFEPFFTTKEPGQGTGLGLAVVHGTMRQHGGWVRCESAPGAGTTFELYFPRTEAPAPEPAAEPADTGPPRPGRGGGETVLVVEDEPSLRGIAREMLQQGGYRVLLAADGAEALEVYRSRPGEIDLVLLDWVMPRLGGEETYRRLRQIDPRARVLFCTGYGVDEASIPAGAAGWIAKPYRKAGLLAAVAAALAGRPVEGDTLPRGLE